jgi:biopolymer transport protein ExbB
MRNRIGFAELPDPALTAFPVLVLLGPPRIDYEQLQADGEDLRFVSANGEPLPYEIEAWDPAGVSTVWVSVDEIGGATHHFFLYYDNPVAENAQDPAALWAAPHVAVWHMTEGTPDSTANANDANEAGSVAVTDGQIGDGAELLTAASRLDVLPSESLADVFVGGATITAWIRPSDWGGADFGRIVHRYTAGVGFQFYVSEIGHLQFTHPSTASNPEWTTFDGALELHRWSHVGVAYEAGSGVPPRLFIDGVEQEQNEPVKPPVDLPASDARVPITIGNRPTNDRVFQGKLDEIRIERTSRSADWIRLQHLSGRDELLVFEPAEHQGGAP